MTRTVEDAALMMSVLSRPDSRDWTALPPSDLPWDDIGPSTPDVGGLRVGLMLDAGCGMPVDPEVAEAVAHAAQAFAEGGAVVEPLAPFLTDELLGDLDTFWRVRSWKDFQALAPDGQARVLPFIRRWVEAAADVSGREVLACYQSIMDIQRRSVAATLPFDVVLSPVAPVPAFPAEWPMPFGDHDGGMVHIGFTAPANMSGQPSISVNAGFTDDGRTIGLAVTGRRFDDIGVLRAAAWWEAARPSPRDRTGRSDSGRHGSGRPTMGRAKRQRLDDLRRHQPDPERPDTVVSTALDRGVAPPQVARSGQGWSGTGEGDEHPEARVAAGAVRSGDRTRRRGCRTLAAARPHSPAGRAPRRPPVGAAVRRGRTAGSPVRRPPGHGRPR